MTKKVVFMLGICLAMLSVACSPREENKPIRSGEIWADNQGTHINAHGGGILLHDGTYYWYGENKSDTTSNAMVGIMCYSSKNLTDWTNEGVALPVELTDTTSDIIQGCIMERPKVIYNEHTRKFVMWFHLELKGQGYWAARSAVAESDTPTGPFRYIGSGRINAGKLPFDMTPEERAVLDTLNPEHYEWDTPAWQEAVVKGLYLKRDLEGGQMARDMQLFVDDDGKAYHIYASEENLTLQIAELSDDFLSHTGKYVRVAPSGLNEAPAIFKKADGTYWMITSGCTGWVPNTARMFSAPSIWGPWTQHPNPCVGPNADLTFGGQSTFVLPIPGKQDAFLFMADIWRPEHPSDARYIWLPIQFRTDGTPFIEWMDSWTLDFFDRTDADRH